MTFPQSRERVYNVLTSRWMNIGITAALFVLFGTVTVSLEHGWPQVIWAVATGVQFGCGFMWYLSPHMTERWRKEMEAEINLMVAKTIHKANTDMVAAAKTWFRSDVDEPPTRRLQ
jgi:hypothetical protein